MRYKHHPAAKLFPLMTGEPFDQLVEDIFQFGLRSSIALHEGKILDGRNRYRACLEAKKEPRFHEAKVKGSPTAYVLSRNLHRRHLDESQRAMIAVKVQPLYATEAKERQRLSKGRGQKGSDNCPDLLPIGDSHDIAGAALNVSGKSVRRAKKVVQAGADELIQAVHNGDVKVDPAAKLAELPKAKQREAVEGGKEAITEAIKKVETKKKSKKTGIVHRDELIGNTIKAIDVMIREIKKREKLTETIREDALNRLDTAKRCVRQSKPVL